MIKRIRECNRPAASFGGDPCDPNMITSQENSFSKSRFKAVVCQVIHNKGINNLLVVFLFDTFPISLIVFASGHNLVQGQCALIWS